MVVFVLLGVGGRAFSKLGLAFVAAVIGARAAITVLGTT